MGTRSRRSRASLVLLSVALAASGCDEGDADTSAPAEAMGSAGDEAIECGGGGVAACDASGSCQVVQAWEIDAVGSSYCKAEVPTAVCFAATDMGCPGAVASYRHVASGQCLLLASDCTATSPSGTWTNDDACPNTVSWDVPTCED